MEMTKTTSVALLTQKPPDKIHTTVLSQQNEGAFTPCQNYHNYEIPVCKKRSHPCRTIVIIVQHYFDITLVQHYFERC